MDPVPVREIVSGLEETGKPLPPVLRQLSNLGVEEMAAFAAAWPVLDATRRRLVARRLVELAAESVKLSYDSIFRYLMGDRDEEVRRLAIEGLWESEDPSLISPFIRIMEQNVSPRVQQAAAKALGRFSVLAELGKLRTIYAVRRQVLYWR